MFNISAATCALFQAGFLLDLFGAFLYEFFVSLDYEFLLDCILLYDKHLVFMSQVHSTGKDQMAR